MKLIGLIVALLLAGCAQNAPVVANSAPIAGSAAPAAQAAAANATPGARTFSFETAIGQTISAETPPCDPSDAPHCLRFQGGGMMYFTGDWKGAASYHAYCGPDNGQGKPGCSYALIAFAGQLGECGYGQIALQAIDTITGAGADGIEFVGNATLIPQSGAGELASVTAIDVGLQGAMGAHGPNFQTHGTMTC